MSHYFILITLPSLLSSLVVPAFTFYVNCGTLIQDNCRKFVLFFYTSLLLLWRKQLLLWRKQQHVADARWHRRAVKGFSDPISIIHAHL